MRSPPARAATLPHGRIGDNASIERVLQIADVSGAWPSAADSSRSPAFSAKRRGSDTPRRSITRSPPRHIRADIASIADSTSADGRGMRRRMPSRRPRKTHGGRTGEVRLFLRVIVDKRRLIGPGRANLLESIDRTGSIAAAAREMHMSYRRAWLHVDDLARQIGSPVVETAQGGSRGGGAILSEAGRTLLHAYRRMQRRTERELAADLERMRRLVKPSRPTVG
jgi:molybdate transport system regulatory protein